jgi:hypothetical protein
MLGASSSPPPHPPAPFVQSCTQVSLGLQTPWEGICVSPSHTAHPGPPFLPQGQGQRKPLSRKDKTSQAPSWIASHYNPSRTSPVFCTSAPHPSPQYRGDILPLLLLSPKEEREQKLHTPSRARGHRRGGSRQGGARCPSLGASEGHTVAQQPLLPLLPTWRPGAKAFVPGSEQLWVVAGTPAYFLPSASSPRGL